MKDPVQVVKANVEAMKLIGRIFYDSETSGNTFFHEVRQSPASPIFQHEQQILDGFTDKEAQILDSAVQKSWSDAMTVSVKRALREHQIVVDIAEGIDASEDKNISVYFKAEPARKDIGQNAPVEEPPLPFIEPPDVEKAIATFNLSEIRGHRDS